MVRVSVRELKNNLAACLRRAESGEELAITRRGKVVAVIRQRPDALAVDTRAVLMKMAEEGTVTWSGEKPRYPRKRVALRGEGPTVSEMVIEDRG
jgi:antitoxin (DNA-binding transcriptional repressor) of toxin-antitoxin stability system